jgi:hypothetical protein
MARKIEKKKSFLSKKNLIGIFIVAIMVLSAVGFIAEQNGQSGDTYMGKRFSLVNGKWQTSVDGKERAFTFHPRDLESINISPDAINYIKSVKMIYVTFDPNSTLVQDFEIMRLDLERELPNFGIYPVTGVASRSTAYSAFPTVTCANATTFVPVIYLKSAETTNVTSQGGCLIFEARESYDVPALKERLLYGLYGII